MKDESITSIKRDVVVSFLLIVLGILAVININSGEVGKITETATLTHSTLPTIYGVLLIFLASVILIGALGKLITGRRGSGPQKINPVTETVSLKVNRMTVLMRTLGTLVLLVAYSFLLAYVNFVTLTALFLALLFILFGRRRPLQIALASILGSAGFYIIFIYFLNLPI